MIEILLYGILGILLLLIFSLMFAPLIVGAPFQPSNRKRLDIMMRFSNVKKGEKVVDIGSGNGKVVIEMAKRGAQAHGYEISPLLVWISRRNIKKAGLKGKAFIHWGNFWKVDLSNFDVVSTFQVFYVMPKLEKKLKKELKSGARVVSNTWKFNDWKPIKKEGGVYLYKL